jgi:hypothetical protein
MRVSLKKPQVSHKIGIGRAQLHPSEMSHLGKIALIIAPARGGLERRQRTYKETYASAALGSCAEEDTL